MLTREENERLTRVGQGTPAGELLRRYWFPWALPASSRRRLPHSWSGFSVKRLSCFAIEKAASVCSMIGAHTAGLRSVTVVSKSGVRLPIPWLAL